MSVVNWVEACSTSSLYEIQVDGAISLGVLLAAVVGGVVTGNETLPSGGDTDHTERKVCSAEGRT